MTTYCYSYENKIFYSLLFYPALFSGFAQEYTWTWAKKFGGVDVSEGQTVVPDRVFTTEEGVYIFARFYVDVLIEDTILYNTAPPDEAERFVAKFKKDGTFLWAEKTNVDMRYDQMEIDHEGNIYMAGVLYESKQVGDTFFRYRRWSNFLH